MRGFKVALIKKHRPGKKGPVLQKRSRKINRKHGI